MGSRTVSAVVASTREGGPAGSRAEEEAKALGTIPTCSGQRGRHLRQAVAETLQNTRPVLLKTAEAVRNKESLGNCHGPEGAKAT